MSDIETTPLSALDELYMHLDRDDEPWSVHLEVRVEGRLDADRLREAASTAALIHPLARARLGSAGIADVGYEWEIPAELDEVELIEVDCAGEGDLDRHRAALLDRSVSLETPGPFALLLAHRDGGDTVVLNFHHAAGDGLSAVRFFASIARAYAGEDDPVPGVDPLSSRTLSTSTPASVGKLLARATTILDYAGRHVTQPVRLAGDGGEERPGYGVAHLDLGPERIQALREGRPDGATVNDVLLGGLAVAIRDFNDTHGATAGTIDLMMPVNLRPPEWRFEVLGNFASYVSVRVGAADQTELGSATAAAAAATQRIKDEELAGLLIELVRIPNLLPSVIKKRLERLIRIGRNALVDTAVLSNLGRVEDVPSFGDAGAVRELSFTPPGRMPLGASLGAATLEDTMRIALRYRLAQFDADGARAFLTCLDEALGG